MSFGRNLQYLRKMMNKMTQEELAEKLKVSRQTVSKWELDTAYPEVDKLIELCTLFSCTLDQLVREDMAVSDEAYSNLRIQWVDAFSYIRYTVVSPEPEEDAIDHVRKWARMLGIEEPRIIGWDFPFVSQEQINVYNFHGYTAALIIPEGVHPEGRIEHQERQKYIAITIRQPSSAPFYVIPNAYKTLMAYMKTNQITAKNQKGIINCYEQEYVLDGIDYMDVFIAIE